MRTALRILACASILASPLAAEACKNHYILSEPLACAWERMASLNVPRQGHTATLLADGSVLVVGGMITRELEYGGTGVLPPDPHTVERYDPASNTWRFAAPLNRGRRGHAATLLHDGRVLVVGGENAYHHSLLGGSAEVYDPVADRWTLMQTNHWQQRWQPAAALLPDGRVLVTGGVDMADILGPAEIYDPGTDRWTLAGELQINRYGHSATALRDGRVLFAGGGSWLMTSIGRYEVYLPPEGRFVLAAAVSLPRYDHAATLLPDGNVLVSGGWVSRLTSARDGGVWHDFTTTGATEVFDAASDTWRAAPDLQVARYAHTSTLLRDGSLLVVGGVRSFGAVPGVRYTTLHSTEMRLDASSPSFALAELNVARSHHTATLLANGSVLVVGGRDATQQATASVELLGPAPAP